MLDNAIIFTALPTIHAAMHFSATGLGWVQDAYTLVFGGLLLFGARACDLLGRRRVFVFGVAVFGLASLLVGVARPGRGLTAPAAVLTARVSAALTAGSVLLALCLIATFALVLPAGLAGRRRAARRSASPAAPERILVPAASD